MPLIEKDSVIQCIICPFLAKKAQEEQQELEQESRAEKEVQVEEDDCTEDIPKSANEMLQKAKEAMKNTE